MPDRATGLTKAMVEALPQEGGHIIVHTGAMRAYVQKMIRDLRGPEIQRKTKVHVIRYVGDQYKLAGITELITFDHAWHEAVPPRLSVAVENLINRARAGERRQRLIPYRLPSAGRPARSQAFRSSRRRLRVSRLPRRPPATSSMAVRPDICAASSSTSAKSRWRRSSRSTLSRWRECSIRTGRMRP